MSVGSALEDLVQIFLGKNLTVNGTTVQVSSLLKGIGALGQVNWPIVVKAIEAGNWQAEAVPIEDVLRVVGLFVPPVAVAEADFEAILPVIQFLVSSVKGATVHVNGTSVTPSWASDPRHQLNPDGTFKS